MKTLNKQDIYQTIVEFKERLRETGKKIIQLTINHEGDEELSEVDYKELLELLHEDEQDVKNFIWIDNLSINYLNQNQTAILNDIKASYSDNEEIFKEALNTMYMDPKINRHLPPDRKSTRLNSSHVSIS